MTLYQKQESGSKVLEELAELESRKQEQERLGVRHHKASEPRVATRGGQAPLELWHARMGHTGKRLLEATQPCVRGMTLTHKDHWQQCDCSTCLRNKPKRSQITSVPVTTRNHDEPVQPFKQTVLDWLVQKAGKATLGS